MGFSWSLNFPQRINAAQMDSVEAVAESELINDRAGPAVFFGRWYQIPVGAKGMKT